jgi:transposase
MRRIREVLRLRAELGANLSAIASGARLARSTVRSYLARAAAAGLDATAAEGLSDMALDAALFAPSPAAGGRLLPDWALIDQELRRHKHVTRKLLWLEYRFAHPDGLGFSQFKQRLSEWQKASGRGLSMRQVHHAGETVEVDYAGDTVAVMDDGTARAAQLFVACLPCSGLIYAEPSWTQSREDWLGAHVRLFAFLGGVPAKVVPDNLKVGVTHASYYDPVINASYAALIRHYGTAVVPARKRKPRDKAIASY